jgi:hypothetical protein
VKRSNPKIEFSIVAHKNRMYSLQIEDRIHEADLDISIRENLEIEELLNILKEQLIQ